MNADSRRILVVCDDWARLEWYEDRLKPKFREFLSEFLWKEAVNSAQREQPDLILIDLVLEDCHGPEFARKLAGGESTCAIPLVIMIEQDELSELQPGESEKWRIITRPFDADTVFGSL